jgi:hypothetical protein
MSATHRPSGLATPGRPEVGRNGSAADGNAQRQQEARGGRHTDGGPRPLEFDEAGFPIPQRNSSFVKRVARLLKPQ